MNNKIAFLDIDTQFDFMNPRGKLYISGADQIIFNLKRLFNFAKENNIPIISSLDTHKKDDPEFKDFPPHCIKGSRGYKKIKETLEGNQIFIVKHSIDVFSNPRIKTIMRPYNIVYVFGVALDYCVKAACLGLVKLEMKTYLIEDATRSVSDRGRVETIDLLKQKGVRLVTTEEVIGGR